MNCWETDPKTDSNGTVKLIKERGQNTGLDKILSMDQRVQ